MDSRDPSLRSYMWTIQNFSRLTREKHYSDVFIVGGCKWRILIYPRGDQLRINLDVPDAADLPTGWSREVYFTLTVVNQNDRNFSMSKDMIRVFKAQEADWGFESFMPMNCLRSLQRGFLVNDSVIVKAELYVLSIVPPIVTPEAAAHGPLDMATPVVRAPRITETNQSPNAAPPVVSARPSMEPNHFDIFFTTLEEFIDTREAREGSSSGVDSNNRMDELISGTPNLKEVEEAKQSLKECLSDLFKLNIKDRLATGLSTLAHAEVGLSCDQQRSIRAFWDNFDDFISDFLMFEQDNSEFELQKLERDIILSSMKKNHETHLVNRRLLDALTLEEEELKRRLEEVNSSKQKLISDWESLMAKAEEMKSKLTAQDKKLAEAEEKKRIAEERMSHSAAAWSSLKTLFAKDSVESGGGTRYLNILPFLGDVLNRQILGFRPSTERPEENGYAHLHSEGSSSVELENNTSVLSALGTLPTGLMRLIRKREQK